MAKVPFNVSVFDLNHVLSQVDKTVDDLTQQEIEEILFSIGMDKKGIETEEVMHRPMYSHNHQPWFGKRYTGFERQDKEWMYYSGKCSLENIISSQGDADHKADLMMMSRQPNFTEEYCLSLEEQSKGGNLSQ